MSHAKTSKQQNRNTKTKEQQQLTGVEVTDLQTGNVASILEPKKPTR